MNIKLTEEDFTTLVKGGELSYVNTETKIEVNIILSDIGFCNMIDILFKAAKEEMKG